jgi:hypothetical protein
LRITFGSNSKEKQEKKREELYCPWHIIWIRLYRMSAQYYFIIKFLSMQY